MLHRFHLNKRFAAFCRAEGAPGLRVQGQKVGQFLALGEETEIARMINIVWVF